MKLSLSKVITLSVLSALIGSPSFANDKLSGSASVSPIGAAVYSVNVEVPKGIGDLKPSLGIAYNSQTGNGVAGWGCNITGLSCITRGMKDVAHDNTVAGVNFQSTDAYYIDGKRLILMSGTEGDNGAVYTPEGEPLTRITLHGRGMSVYFTADTNDGMTYEYGGGSSCLTLPTSIAAWYISKATNAQGQTITYSYNLDNLYLYPQTVTYGSDNTVSFEYENRTDTVRFALKQSLGYVTKRLKKITTKSGSSTYRTYTLSYNSTSDASTTKFSRLTSITEVGENGDSSRKLTANWNYLPSFTPTAQGFGVTLPSNGNQIGYDGQHVFVAGDINADGISDLLYHVSGRENGTVFSYVFTYNSYFQNGNLLHGQSNWYKFQTSISSGPLSVRKFGLSVNDINGDGLNDIVCPSFETAYSYHYFRYEYILGGGTASTGDYAASKFFPLKAATEIPLYGISDFNKNGKNDFVILEKQKYSGKYYCHLVEYTGEGTADSICSVGLTLTYAPKHLFVADYNNDGLSDILVLSDIGSRIFYNHGGPNLSGLFTDSSTLSYALKSHERIEQADFNGDGVADLIWNDNNSNRLYFELGNGNGTFTQQLAYTLPYNTYSTNKDANTWSCIPIDIDQDGKSDVVVNYAAYLSGVMFNNTYTCWLRSDGHVLTSQKQSTSTRVDDAKCNNIFCGDFKGNGILEIANYGYNCYNGVNANVDAVLHFYRSNSQTVSSGRACSFTDSNGRSTAFTYSPMTSSQVYTKGAGGQYPVIDIAAPLCIVSQMQESGGSAVSTSTSYHYSGLRAHLLGRGLLGFRQLTACESNTGKTVVTTTSNDHSTYLVPTKTTTVTTQGGFTSSVESTANLITFPAATSVPTSNFMLFPSVSTETDIYGNETATTYTYHADHHYLLSERTEYGGSNMYRQVCYSYPSSKIAGAWRPTSITHIQKHGDSNTAFSALTTISYNSNGLRTTVIENAGTSLPLTTTYQYDGFGNVIKEKLSGTGVNSNTETNYQYSSNGKYLTQKSTPAETIGYTRNVFGDITAQTDLTNTSNPLTTTYSYDGFGRMVSEQKPTGETTTWVRTVSSDYGGAYSITQHTLGYPSVQKWYDALDHEVRQATTGIKGIAISTQNSYNVRGELTVVTKVHGNLTTTESYTYDGLGRQTAFSSTNGKNISYVYGNQTTQTTEDGHTTTKTFDAWGNILTVEDPLSSVSYSYHSNGNPSAVTSEGSTVSMFYDATGNQTSLDDPDAGATSYQYDALHRVIRQTDARGVETVFSYDAAGRLLEKTVDGTATTYTYGTSGYGTGHLVSQQSSGRTISYSYDSVGRLSQETHTMSGEPSLSFGYHYDQWGRLSSKDYPQGITVDYHYYGGCRVASTLGDTNISLITADNGTVFSRSMGGTLEDHSPAINPVLLQGNAASVNAVSDSLLHENLYYTVASPAFTHTASYDSRGILTQQQTKRSFINVKTITYGFESGTGNLLSRTGMGTGAEQFTYDALDRLTEVSRAGVTQQAISYAGNGNITSKTGLGNYSYGASTRPHAVTGVQNPSGSISSASQSISYTPFGKVSAITEGNYRMDFTYGPDEERWKTVLKQSGTAVRTTLYADEYERITENGVTRHFYYLDGGAIYVLEDGQTEGTFYYAITDHLGSYVSICRPGHPVITAFSATYDAWGQQTVTTNTLGFHRGYTGHEMLPEFGLINMNGRLYDPILGRFLSPDNYVQMPDYSQSFNRYGYCLNNPLKYKDPSGNYILIDDIIAGLVGGTINLVCNVIQGNIDNFLKGVGAFAAGSIGGIGNLYPQFGGHIWGGAIVGATNAALSGEDFTGIFVGSLTGIASSIVGSSIGIFATGYISNITLNSMNIASPVVKGLLTGITVGAISGYVTGFGFTLLTTGSLKEANKSGLQNATIGAVNGVISGAIAGYRYAKTHNISPWKAEQTHRHHPHPVFMGGKNNQPLSPMNKSRHQDLHKDLYNYLRNYDIERGDGLKMIPTRGNSSIEIQNNFSPELRFNTIKNFYDTYPYKYFDIRRAFYSNNHLEWRFWPVNNK